MVRDSRRAQHILALILTSKIFFLVGSKYASPQALGADASRVGRFSRCFLFFFFPIRGVWAYIDGTIGGALIVSLATTGVLGVVRVSAVVVHTFEATVQFKKGLKTESGIY